jgi:hypothetical protein
MPEKMHKKEHEAFSINKTGKSLYGLYSVSAMS